MIEVDEPKNSHAAQRRKKLPPITPREWLLLLVLAAIQFTAVVDFIIIMPLQPAYWRLWPDLTEMGFGIIVGSYAFAAGCSGLFGAFFTDRWDRKKSLLVLYAGFTIGTLLCGVVSDYWSLVAARVVAGAFGGIMGAVALAIIGDLFHDERRGRATGVLMWGFSLATILGVPAGLFLKNVEGGGPGLPFVALAALSLAIWVISLVVLPTVRGHLAGPAHQIIHSMIRVMTDATHLRAYLFMFFLIMSTFLLFPFVAGYVVANIGLDENWELPWVYVCGGGATFFVLPVVGWLADRFGKPPVFRVMGALTAVPILLITNLQFLVGGIDNRGYVVALTYAATTLLMVFASGRSVPAMAMITASSRPRYRGGFLSFTAAVQQFAGAIASGVAGCILDKDKRTGHLEHFWIIGLIGAGITIGSVFMAELLRPAAIEPDVENEPETEEELTIEGRASDTGVVSPS
jgi:MFS transporter, DHA1 family, inner membrane transport protein